MICEDTIQVVTATLIDPYFIFSVAPSCPFPAKVQIVRDSHDVSRGPQHRVGQVYEDPY